MLMIKAKGGLGNRMLSAASAILYAEATRRPWHVDWSDGIYANKPQNAYSLMFQDKCEVPCPHPDDFSRIVPAIWQGKLDQSPTRLMSQHFPSHHSNPFIYRKMSAPFTARSVQNQLEVFWSYTSKYGRVKSFLAGTLRDRDFAISTVLKSHFQPCETVKQRVESLARKATGKTLGVHIRYTDLKVPIEKVMDITQQCLDAGSFSTIFLATDSAKAEQLFRQRFDRVLTSNKHFADNNHQLHTLKPSDTKLDNSYAALVDMIMLSMCDALVYCSRSTFSETSRLLGDFDRDSLFDLDRFSLKIRFKRFLQEYL